MLIQSQIFNRFIQLALVATLAPACIAVAPQAGLVIDANGTPVANATVSIAGTSTKVVTDAKGNFAMRLESTQAPRVLNVNADGFARLTARITDANTQLIRLQVQAIESTTQLVLPGAGEAPVQAVLTRGDSTMTLTIPPNSMATPSGAVANGNVTVSLTYWDGLQGMNTSPGPLLAKDDHGGAPIPLTSVGMADIEVRQGNDLLQVVPGMYLGWDIKAPAPIKTLMTAPTLHDNTYLFWLNPETALWENVAPIDSAMFTYDAGTNTLSGKLPHLSSWNFDMMNGQSGCVQGRVLDCQGNPIPNTPFSGWLMNFEGLYHANWNTDASGHYCENVQVPANDAATNGQWTFPIHLSGPDSPTDSNMNPDIISQACVQCTEETPNVPAGECYCGKYNQYGNSYCPPQFSGCAWIGQNFGSGSSPYAQESFNYDGVVADKIVTVTTGTTCPSTACVQLPDLVIGTCSGGTPITGSACAGPNPKTVGMACGDTTECCSKPGAALSCLDGLCVPDSD